MKIGGGGVVRSILQPTVGPTYVGPADAAGATLAAFWGLRAPSASKAATAPYACIDLNGQPGSHAKTVNITTSGDFDIADLNSWISTFSITSIQITKLYDHIGTHHLIANNTSILLKTSVIGLGATGVAWWMNSAGDGSVLAESGTLTVNAPWSISAVYRPDSTVTPTIEVLLWPNGSRPAVIYRDALTKFTIDPGGGEVDDTTAAQDAWYAVNCSGVSGPTTKSRVNGTSHTDSSASVSNFSGTSASQDGGYSTERGIWGSDISSSFAALESNQRTYWGF